MRKLAMVLGMLGALGATAPFATLEARDAMGPPLSAAPLARKRKRVKSTGVGPLPRSGRPVKAKFWRVTEADKARKRAAWDRANRKAAFRYVQVQNGDQARAFGASSEVSRARAAERHEGQFLALFGGR